MYVSARIRKVNLAVQLDVVRSIFEQCRRTPTVRARNYKRVELLFGDIWQMANIGSLGNQRRGGAREQSPSRPSDLTTARRLSPHTIGTPPSPCETQSNDALGLCRSGLNTLVRVHSTTRACDGPDGSGVDCNGLAFHYDNARGGCGTLKFGGPASRASPVRGRTLDKSTTRTYDLSH